MYMTPPLPDRGAAEAIGALCYTNPFAPERIALEKRALGAAHRNVQQVWHRASSGFENPNVERLGERALGLIQTYWDGPRLSVPDADLSLYEDLVRYRLFFEHEDDLLAVARASRDPALAVRPVSSFESFARSAHRWLAPLGRRSSILDTLPHLFACLFQIRRAFLLVYERILGTSAPAAALRAATWQSIFTHDMRRYQRGLHRRMHEIPTLITGPSGTGKELVARAIGMARYVPFDGRRRVFQADLAGDFFALNLSALAPTVIESELFGHRKGAFTGAVQDRKGWLELCSDAGTVFVDEIGELDASVQVKLLRVLQSRRFQRVGETQDRAFAGKIVAATNRDLAVEMRAGRFREDFYYRLCADAIATPSLASQLRDAPADLPLFVRAAAERIVEPEEVDATVHEMVQWITTHLGADYPWPGNVRELEQCVRSLLVRGEYRPASRPASSPSLGAQMERGELTAEELLDAYCAWVHGQAGTYVEAARRLGLDRRTVQARARRSGERDGS
jgi:hypothetical protein